jgi:hypothetical protein
VLQGDRLRREPPIQTDRGPLGDCKMSKIVMLAAVASATLFTGAASAHGRGSNYGHNAPIVSAGVGAKVAPLGTQLGLGATVGGRGGLLNVQTGLHTPVANVGLGVSALSHGQLLNLDLGAFSGGVGR